MGPERGVRSASLLGAFIWLAQVTMFIDASIYMAADGGSRGL